MGDDSPVRQAVGFVSPLFAFADSETQKGNDPDKSFTATLGKKGAATGGPVNSPSLGDASQGAINADYQRQQRIQSASTILTGGAGLVDDPSTYSASRALLGS